MIYEKQILKALSKARKLYKSEYDDELAENIFVEIYSIEICYDDSSFAIADLHWGSFNGDTYQAQILVNENNIHHLDAFMLGYMSAIEELKQENEG